MRPFTRVTRSARRLGFTSLLLCMFTLCAARGFSVTPNSQTIQATYAQAGKVISVTLIIYNYSTPSDLQLLSKAFTDGNDQGLVTALSKTKAAGRCSIAGALSYDVAFIQMVQTPTGRTITFVTNRPHATDSINPDATAQPFDLAVGQFDLNDTDNTKSTGFLYPASKLLVDKQGEFHYDLAGAPWSLVNVLDSKQASGDVASQGPAK